MSTSRYGLPVFHQVYNIVYGGHKRKSEMANEMVESGIRAGNAIGRA
jgi:hypothetical protein